MPDLALSDSGLFCRVRAGSVFVAFGLEVRFARFLFDFDRLHCPIINVSKISKINKLWPFLDCVLLSVMILQACAIWTANRYGLPFAILHDDRESETSFPLFSWKQSTIIDLSSFGILFTQPKQIWLNPVRSRHQSYRCRI